MNLTQKESGLLTDMKGQEELCIKKYKYYASSAKAPELRAMFEQMQRIEESHLQSVCGLMNGSLSAPPDKIENSNNDCCKVANYMNEDDRKSDAFMCQDMLASEKHASALYDTAIFEFKDPTARKMLNHIQAEEQQHGEQIYAYMSMNGMYN